MLGRAAAITPRSARTTTTRHGCPPFSAADLSRRHDSPRHGTVAAPEKHNRKQRRGDDNPAWEWEQQELPRDTAERVAPPVLRSPPVALCVSPCETPVPPFLSTDPIFPPRANNCARACAARVTDARPTASLGYVRLGQIVGRSKYCRATLHLRFPHSKRNTE